MTGTRQLRVLFVEDTPDDALLVARELERGGFEVDAERVETLDGLQTALQDRAWDLVIGDYHLPGLPVARMVAAIREHDPDVPFLMVSGTVDEQAALEVMRAGAHDFLSKDRLERLIPALERELREAAVRRREAETRDQLALSEARFRLIAEHIEDTFWISAPDKSSFDYVSPAYETTWGRSRDSLYSNPKQWLESVHPEDRQRVSGALPAQPRGEFEERYRIVRPDGEVRWIWDRAFPVHDEDGRVARVVGVAEDITERVTLEERLLHSQKMEAVGRLAGGVAHDFNNLLTVIGGRADLLLMEVGHDSELREDVEEIQRAVRHASSLTRRLLAFSKRQILNLQRIRVEEVVGEMEQMARRIIGETVGLEVELSEAPGDVVADPGQLEQVILNLVVNAREALESATGLIRIRTGRAAEDLAPLPPESKGDPTWCTVEVADNGSGIAPHVLDRIFEPFFTTKREGTGLGLSTVFGIVDQLGGGIDVESEPGRGTRFRIHLPVAGGSGTGPA